MKPLECLHFNCSCNLFTLRFFPKKENIEENSPLGLTPSSSMAVMSTVGDTITLTQMELNGVTKDDYGLHHHGGYLGEK